MSWSFTGDVWLLGGFSILSVLIVFALPRDVAFYKSQAGALFSLLSIAVNWPHFMASYRLLYSSREHVFAHRFAAVYIPALLLSYALFALSSPNPVHTNLFIVGSGVYLARHYTGQAWGMMASYSYIDRTPFTEMERRWIRAGLNGLMVWHMSWALTLTIGTVLPSWAPLASAIYPWMGKLAIAASGVGFVGMLIACRRVGRLLPLRVVVPWLAIHMWYLLLARDATAIALVQMGHALQYLSFPGRAEANRAAETGSKTYTRTILFWLGGMIALGIVALSAIPAIFSLGFHAGGASGPLPTAFYTVIVSAINIHHYFSDGVLYKLRNPEVRRLLFSHLKLTD